MIDGTSGYKLANTKDLAEKVVEKSLTFNLTEQDFAEKGKLAGKLAGELASLEAEFDAVKKSWKDRVEDKEGELTSVLSTIRKRQEDRIVKCIEQKDFKRHVVSYIFNGEVMHERPMDMNERQMELVQTGTKVKKSEAEEKAEMEAQLDAAKAGVGANGAKLVPVKPDSDVQDVIREETNRKTKQDMSSRG